MIKTPNEAVASIKNRQDAIQSIRSLYGVFDTEIGTRFLLDELERHAGEVLDWLPDDVLIELAKNHMRKEWEGYPWES